ncbi:MAG: alpha/beta fold hydrolase [Phycisphaera sp.]|nr:alpha/beta fold hydrolase [Phycisphaera sp.]
MKLPDYPFTPKSVDIDGHHLFYLDEGPGGLIPAPNVVMLHGNPTWSFYYRRLVSALSDRYRCVVPDHIGMGLSDKPAKDEYRYTLEQRVDDLDALLGEINVTEDITLVLHDWGGMIGMAYACRYPERIARLVLLNTGAFRHPAGKRLPWQIRLARTAGLGSFLVRQLNLFSKGAVTNCVTRGPMPEDVANAYLMPYDTPEHRVAVHEFVRDIPVGPGDEAWDRVLEVEAQLGQFSDRPALLCWGMRDFVFDADFLDKWRQLLPDAEVHRFKDAGHYVLEDAHEEIIPLVSEFLDRETKR